MIFKLQTSNALCKTEFPCYKIPLFPDFLLFPDLLVVKIPSKSMKGEWKFWKNYIQLKEKLKLDKIKRTNAKRTMKPKFR